ncbi:hypothetical protein ABIB62_001582 [Mucilaginibacter sp. UYP25]|uniref:hypothetical protein n=1 Tax=unclassified Mucilaginibacter TaxID=2617802 RepID=UPI003392FC9C
MLTQQLEALYTENEARFELVRETLKDHDIHGPYLSSPTELYLLKANKLLIIGQETYGWKNHPDIISQMKSYEEFQVGKTHPSPFWSVARKMEEALGNARYSCAALNLNKFDVRGGRPKTEEQIGPIRELDDIIIEEIKIINPTICVFFTSHNSDYRLKNLYRDLEFIAIDSWNVKELCVLRHPNLPKFTFRTYHPGFLRRKGLVNKLVDSVLSQVSL